MSEEPGQVAGNLWKSRKTGDRLSKTEYELYLHRFSCISLSQDLEQFPAFLSFHFLCALVVFDVILLSLLMLGHMTNCISLIGPFGLPCILFVSSLNKITFPLFYMQSMCLKLARSKKLSQCVSIRAVQLFSCYISALTSLTCRNYQQSIPVL